MKSFHLLSPNHVFDTNNRFKENIDTGG